MNGAWVRCWLCEVGALCVTVATGASTTIASELATGDGRCHVGAQQPSILRKTGVDPTLWRCGAWGRCKLYKVEHSVFGG